MTYPVMTLAGVAGIGGACILVKGVNDFNKQQSDKKMAKIAITAGAVALLVAVVRIGFDIGCMATSIPKVVKAVEANSQFQEVCDQYTNISAWQISFFQLSALPIFIYGVTSGCVAKLKDVQKILK